MAIKISTALRNYMLGAGSFKSAFADSHILLYSGSPPATADLGVTGTHLLTVTKASGTLAAGALSTPQMAKLTCSGTDAAGTFRVTINGVAYNQAYSGSLNASTALLANVINRNCPEFMAAVLTATAIIYLVPRSQGNSGDVKYTITGATVVNDVVTVDTDDSFTYALSTGLNFAAAGVVAGTIDKPSSTLAVWSGLGLTAAGTGTSAGYFRLMRSDDTGAVDSTPFLYERVQGTVGTSGSDLVLSSATIVSGATTTIDGFKFTLPETV